MSEERKPFDFFDSPWWKDMNDKLCADGWPQVVVPLNCMVREAQEAYDKLTAELSSLKKSKLHAEEWYAVRWARLRELLVHTELEEKACAIMANGTATPEEPPKYSTILSLVKNERDALQVSLRQAEEKLNFSEAQLQQNNIYLEDRIAFYDSYLKQKDAEIQRLKQNVLRVQNWLGK